MKQLIILLTIFGLLSSCRKSSDTPYIKGKLVYRSCATIAVEVLDSNYYNLGQASWQQSNSKPVYEHVFAVANNCSFPGSVTVGQEFLFKVVPFDASMKDCVTCALFDNPPAKTQIIKVSTASGGN